MDTKTKSERVKWEAVEWNIRTEHMEHVALAERKVLARQIVHEHNTYDKLVELLRETLNCLFPTGQDTKTDRTITKVVQAIAAAEKEEG